MGWGIFLLVVILFFVARSIDKSRAKAAVERAERARRESIYSKYGRTEVAERILSKTIWVGETADQLIDSLGHPSDTDETVLKTKRKEIWKYYPKSTSRYGLRVKVENGVVVGWDEKL